MVAADEPCCRNYSRLFEGGRCINDVFVGLYYFVILCCFYWVLSQCYVRRRRGALVPQTEEHAPLADAV